MGVHFCCHNRHLYMSVVKSNKTRYICACLQANDSSNMALCRTCFLITFKPELSIRVFLQGYLAISVHVEVAIATPRLMGIPAGPKN